MKRLLTLAISLALFSAAIPAMAQNTPAADSITVSAPNGWNNVADPNEISETRVYIFTQPESENRIEVFRRPLLNTAHATTLFTAFQEQLVASNFTQINPPKDRVYDLANGKKLSGSFLEFAYNHEDIDISIVAFACIYRQQAYIFVGYLAPIAKTAGLDDFNALIQSLDISPEE